MGDIMTPQEEARALANAERVRKHARYMQIMPDPHCADNVQLRLHGRNQPWHTLHVLNAIAFARDDQRRRRRARLQRLLKSKEPIHRTRLRAALIAMFNIDEIKARRDALLKKGITP
jgi:hypothetical protein